MEHDPVWPTTAVMLVQTKRNTTLGLKAATSRYLPMKCVHFLSPVDWWGKLSFESVRTPLLLDW